MYLDSSVESVEKMPQIIRQYSGNGKSGEQDIFFLLRPRTNSYKIESIILKVIRDSFFYPKKIWLEYLANLPGEFLKKYNIIPTHYHNKYYFCINGKRAFTKSMKKKFEERFHKKFDSCRILGGFEALKVLNMDEISLASKWICTKTDMFDYIEGQTISKIQTPDKQELFIINCDTPSFIAQHYTGTNCAVMLLRTTLSYKEIHFLIKKIIHSLYINKATFLYDFKNDKVIQDYFDLSEEQLLRGGYKRFFHYSNGPFEQLHDGIDFLYNLEGDSIPIDHMTFAHYLRSNNVDINVVLSSLRNPIRVFNIKDKKEEHSLYSMTYHMSFQQSLDMYRNMGSQVIID